MPRFRVGFSEENYGYYYFDADNLEDAQRLLDQASNYEIDIEDLPSFNQKTNGGQWELQTELLEEI